MVIWVKHDIFIDVDRFQRRVIVFREMLYTVTILGDARRDGHDFGCEIEIRGLIRKGRIIRTYDDLTAG